MTGTGRTVGVPDELTFSLSVGLVRPDLQTALSDANATMNRVLTSLDRLGVRRSDVQTTGLTMNAVYDYHAFGPPTLRGYHVGQRATVLVRDLTPGRPGRLGGRRGRRATTSASATSASRSPTPTSLLAQSRDAAVKQATVKAQQYADATGQTLGAVLSLREVHVTPVVPQVLHFARSAFDAYRARCRSARARTSSG